MNNVPIHPYNISVSVKATLPNSSHSLVGCQKLDGWGSSWCRDVDGRFIWTAHEFCVEASGDVRWGMLLHLSSNLSGPITGVIYLSLLHIIFLIKAFFYFSHASLLYVGSTTWSVLQNVYLQKLNVTLPPTWRQQGIKAVFYRPIFTFGKCLLLRPHVKHS